MNPRTDFLYGTAWKEERTEACVTAALEAGFRAIDTANQRKHYFEAGVGAALSGWFASHPRESLFLQTKFTFISGQDERLPYDPEASTADQVDQSVASSKVHLGVDFLDSLVLHGPSQREGLGERDHQAWAAMEQHKGKGVGVLGVSNVSLRQLEALCDAATVPPTFVQNRCYASRGWDAEVRAFCAQQAIIYQGFSLLTANRDVWNHKRVGEMARARGCAPAQVIFAFARTLGILPLTGTTDPRHMAKNLEPIAPLTDEELGFFHSSS